MLAAIPSMKSTYAASWTRSISSRLAARSVDVAREGGMESDDALGRLGMRRMHGRMETGERRMADQVQPSASSKRRATAGTPSSVAYAAAAVQSGATSGSGGSGASRSIVAMRR